MSKGIPNPIYMFFGVILFVRIDLPVDSRFETDSSGSDHDMPDPHEEQNTQNNSSEKSFDRPCLFSYNLYILFGGWYSFNGRTEPFHIMFDIFFFCIYFVSGVLLMVLVKHVIACMFSFPSSNYGCYLLYRSTVLILTQRTTSAF